MGDGRSGAGAGDEPRFGFCGTAVAPPVVEPDPPDPPDAFSPPDPPARGNAVSACRAAADFDGVGTWEGGTERLAVEVGEGMSLSTSAKTEDAELVGEWPAPLG